MPCAFSELVSVPEMLKVIESAKTINRTPVLPKRNSVSKNRQSETDRWLRDFWSMFESWKVIFGLTIPTSKHIQKDNETLVTQRSTLCLIMDFMNALKELPFLPADDYDVMDVMVDSRIAEAVRARAVPGHDPWSETAIKDFEPIVKRFWEGRPIDLRKLILIGDLRFYFESILFSVIDWVSKDLKEEAKKPLSPKQQETLEIIRIDGPIKREVLARKLGITPGAVSRIIRTLESHGYKIKNDRKQGNPGFYLEAS